MAKRKSNRVVTNEDIKRYTPVVNKYMRDFVARNWNEARITNKDLDVSLGNTGMSMNDVRQYLFTELVVGLQNYDPEYRTPEGRSVKELTFIYTHLYNRIGSFLKRATKRRGGYGIWSLPLEEAIGDRYEDD